MYLCYLHNNITMVLIPKVQNKASKSYIFSKKKKKKKFLLLFLIL